MELEAAAEKLLKENIKLEKGEKVVLVTDRKKCSIFDALQNACKKFGAKTKVLRLSSEREHSSPIPEAKKLFAWADVIIAPTDKSISHSPETYGARKKFGVRVASMPGITSELFIKAMEVNINKIKELNQRIGNLLDGAKAIDIVTKRGAHLKLNVKGVKFSTEDNGDISKPGVLNNVPFGEIFGLVTKGVGKIVIDHWGTQISPKDNAWVYIRRGKIVEWNKSASSLIKKLKNAGECGLKIVEFGIGTNYAFKRPIGNILHDEKIYGTAHVAFGGFGTVRKCPIHTDVIILDPTIWVDGIKIIDGGKLIK